MAFPEVQEGSGLALHLPPWLCLCHLRFCNESNPQLKAVAPLWGGRQAPDGYPYLIKT